MGCTSSAPSTLSTNGNTAEKMQFVEEAADVVAMESDVVEKVGDIQTAVLPSCDLLIETIVNNNKSSTSLESENNNQDQNPDQTELDDKIEILQDTENEEKLSKLEEVVEKVVEAIHCTDDTDESATDAPAQSGSSPPEESNISDTGVEEETSTGPTNEEIVDVTSQQDNEVENESVENQEDSDISLLEFSRATRWEALADIVAELPPSLAVDPITGQIYSLTK